MDKYDYIESIVLFLRGVTGINYQLQLKGVLDAYYKYLGKTYEMPDFYGGDQKNDGCVLEDGLFYQIFAPTRLKESLKKEMQEKFSQDLEGLLKVIYEGGKWGGSLKEFIFIVNTFDNNLPHDSEGFFEQKVREYEDQYAITFKYKVTNTDYIRDILMEIDDIEVLKKISAALRIRGMMDHNAVTEQIIIDLIIAISGNLNWEHLNGKAVQSYERISSVKKISINSLDDKRERIEGVIAKLDVVENAANSINQDILYEDKFERVRDLIICKYDKLSEDYQGVDLYNRLVDELLSYSNNLWHLEVAVEYLVVYVFDKCDIFEKEEGLE